MSSLPECRDILQKEMGRFPIVLIETFQNWGKTQSMKVLSVRPKNVDEVKRVVHAAKSLRDQDSTFKPTIRCVGDAHSWSPLFPDEGHILMYTADLVLLSGERIKLNEPQNVLHDITVTIAPGVTTGELSDFFSKNNVCIKSDVILDKVTYGGVIATGCHGVGKDEMSVSDKVTGMTLVEANGDIRTLDFTKREFRDSKLVNALKCNLGLFGVMTDLTLKVEPMVIVKVENDFSLSVKDVFYDQSKLKQLYDNNWSVEIFWFPYNSMSWFCATVAACPCLAKWASWDANEDKLWIRKINIAEVPDGPCPTATDYAYKSGKDLVSTSFGRLLSEKLNESPALVPSFLKAGFEMIQRSNSGPPKFELINKAIHYQSFIEVFPVLDMEFAFNVDANFTDQAKAMQIVVERCQKLFSVDPDKREFPLSMAMEMRWMASSEALMCPARAASSVAEGGSGKTLYLEVLGIAGQPENKTWEDFTNYVASEWMKICSGGKAPVPHWAKQWYYIPNICAYIQKMYGEALTEFKSLSGEDYSVFTNKALREAIYEKAEFKEDKPESVSVPAAKPYEKELILELWQTDGQIEKEWENDWMSLAERTWILANDPPKTKFKSMFDRISKHQKALCDFADLIRS